MAGGVYCRVGGMCGRGQASQGGPAWWEACMKGCMHGGGRGMCGRGQAWPGDVHGGDVHSSGCWGCVGGHAWPWGAWPGGMCGRGRVSVEGVCMVGACMGRGVSDMAARVAGETATASGWYASYWNTFLFCRKLQESETI